MRRLAMAVFAVTLGLSFGAADARAARLNGEAEAKSERSAVPTNYRVLVAAYIKQRQIDPASIRYAGISPIAKRPTGVFHGGRRPTVCVQYDAKDASGNYAGLSSSVYWFEGGRVAGVRNRRSFCKDASYTAFPEAETSGAVASRWARSQDPASRRAPRSVQVYEEIAMPRGPMVYADDRRGDIWFRQR